MVTVIEYGNVSECQCNICHSKLRYHDSDILHKLKDKYYYFEDLLCIRCPVCENLIEVDKTAGLNKELDICSK